MTKFCPIRRYIKIVEKYFKESKCEICTHINEIYTYLSKDVLLDAVSESNGSLILGNLSPRFGSCGDNIIPDTFPELEVCLTMGTRCLV